MTPQVDFDGAYPIEGAKEVATLMTRYVTRALRERSSPPARDAAAVHVPAPSNVRLRIAPDGRRLVAETEELRTASRAAPQIGSV